MARNEDCLHCRDLQEELEQIRVHQRVLNEKIESSTRIINAKYEADLNLFLHCVTSLQEQFKALSNVWAHIQESMDILKYMMEKLNTPSASSPASKSLVRKTS